MKIDIMNDYTRQEKIEKTSRDKCTGKFPQALQFL